MIIHPSDMTLLDWTDAMSFLVENSSPIFRLDDPESWREWGQNLLNTPDFLGQNVPNPDFFQDWRVWAMQLFNTVEFTG